MPGPLIVPAAIGAGMVVAGTAGAIYGMTRGASAGDRYFQQPGEQANALGELGSNVARPMYGGYDEGANDMSRLGQAGMAAGQAGSGWSLGEAQGAFNRGPQAYENQALSDQEAYAAGYDQNGSIQLAREAAMGQSPSEAAYLMQSGLDRGIAAQQSAAGSARGGAGIALAQGNAGANIANLQQQAYTQAGALRAKEMGEARGLYNQAATAQRGQEQNRLQMANQVGQYNANLNDQYAQGMGQLGNAYLGTANQWYGNSQNPYNSQMQGDAAYENAILGSYDKGEERKQRSMETMAEIKQANANRVTNFFSGIAGTGGQVVGAAYKGGGGGKTP